MSCECKSNGFCHRYSRYVVDRQRYLCRTSPKHRELFEQIAQAEKKKDAYPSIFVSTFAFVSHMISWLLIGFIKIDNDTYNSRIAICKGDNSSPCPNYDFGWCRSCGCYLPVKALSPLSHCPKMKWPAIEVGGDKTFWGRLASRMQKRSCGCGSKSAPPSLPIIQGDP